MLPMRPLPLKMSCSQSSSLMGRVAPPTESSIVNTCQNGKTVHKRQTPFTGAPKKLEPLVEGLRRWQLHYTLRYKSSGCYSGYYQTPGANEHNWPCLSDLLSIPRFIGSVIAIVL